MRLRNLYTFLTVARLGSFHAAAAQLHASQPAISARISALEDELNVQLFARDKRGTQLTPRGVQLLPYAEKLIAISHEMKAQLLDDAPERGTLRIGIVDTLTHLWLSQLLTRWHEEHPLIAFELISDTTASLITQLKAADLDLVLMVADEHPLPSFVTEPLCSYPQRWVASPAMTEVEHIKGLRDITEHAILSFPRNTRPWRYLKELFEPLGELAPVIHTCSSVASLLSLVKQGVGIALLPEPLVMQEVYQKKLILVENLPKAPALNFCCAWRLDDDRILPRLLTDTARRMIATH
ncbi:Transcriptional regulator, LysR family [Marinobacterium lacunae]|uniref:Transcriptional regulator, LysR family n=1 Tax=Marinobacterium lacunae TaxID=1232683 RepID=A0A081FW01_9GAMM|nr:LysR family transcriptional regulator [Marinobacterium lacunae]KEA62706.1 Transcriptional regulator, LysR family [Marinobacterium lacunae]MBR9884797.1 LysR family transcriptional regulator [Oceanospirillales bacterium]